MMGTSKRTTIRQVARAAGVSTQTVSRVINDRPDVSSETRVRVQRIIQDLDYQPSALARSLIQQRSFTLGVVTAGLKFIGPSRTLNGITRKAEELGYALLLEELPRFEVENVKPILQSLLARHVDGIVWAAPQVGDNHRWVDEALTGVPVPIAFLVTQPRPGILTVCVDNYSGAVAAVEHLLAQGRRRVAHVSGPIEWLEARQRKQAWQETLEKAGLRADDRKCAEGNWSSWSGEEAFLQLLQTYPEMDAVFVGNDQMALAVLRVAHRRGIKIPEDLAVVGFDNIVESAFFSPALTTINQNQDELGCEGVQGVVNRIEAAKRGEEIAPRDVLLPTELIVRESSVSS